MHKKWKQNLELTIRKQKNHFIAAQFQVRRTLSVREDGMEREKFVYIALISILCVAFILSAIMDMNFNFFFFNFFLVTVFFFFLVKQGTICTCVIKSISVILHISTINKLNGSRSIQFNPIKFDGHVVLPSVWFFLSLLPAVFNGRGKKVNCANASQTECVLFHNFSAKKKRAKTREKKSYGVNNTAISLKLRYPVKEMWLKRLLTHSDCHGFHVAVSIVIVIITALYVFVRSIHPTKHKFIFILLPFLYYLLAHSPKSIEINEILQENSKDTHKKWRTTTTITKHKLCFRFFFSSMFFAV